MLLWKAIVHASLLQQRFPGPIYYRRLFDIN
jgi:hypothetical protein